MIAMNLMVRMHQTKKETSETNQFIETETAVSLIKKSDINEPAGKIYNNRIHSNKESELELFKMRSLTAVESQIEKGK